MRSRHTNDIMIYDKIFNFNRNWRIAMAANYHGMVQVKLV